MLERFKFMNRAAERGIKMPEYKFWGAKDAKEVTARKKYLENGCSETENKKLGIENEQSDIENDYSAIKNATDLYDLLKKIWCRKTCAPRMQDGWSEDNPTHGQCSITAFLAQDIFGGDVYAVKTANGVHCYNVVNGISFDLTSEQFGDKAKDLDYTPVLLQDREAPNHFGNGEKKDRYLLLKSSL